MHTFLSSYLALPYTLLSASIGRLYLHREIDREICKECGFRAGRMGGLEQKRTTENYYGSLPLYSLYSNELHLSGF
jgi:hypothetical protein